MNNKVEHVVFNSKGLECTHCKEVEKIASMRLCKFTLTTNAFMERHSKCLPSEDSNTTD